MHELIGQGITYRSDSADVECTILEVKAGRMRLDLSSKIGSPVFKASYRAKLQPKNGGKAFWTGEIQVTG